ncbi:putative ATP-dependent DNA helicase YjcD [Lachnospiraceae bacterium TWA4]|nr:putative ATP-dependent DNA helicase YjcD [Lachnospiraceae bacterium TWA4]
MNFTPSQSEAIMHKDGPMMVLAGPGSGKTMVLTHRIKELVCTHKVSPSNILVVTFTKAAAIEMENRYNGLMQSEETLPSGRVSFGTFHSIFFKILRFTYHYTGNNIIREEQKRAFFKEIVKHQEIEIDDEKEFISEIISEIGKIKSELVDVNQYSSRNCPTDLFRQIYHQYQEYLNENRLIDFDDMQVLCYELFRDRPDILQAWQEKYQYILVDEFQDICQIQYEVIKMMAAPRNNLFIVGDDDQAIYRFRGAKPEIMLGFENDYPTTKKVLLDINYRCDGHIVDASLKLIGKNKNRFDKAIHAKNEAVCPIRTRQFPDTVKESIQIAREIRQFHEQGIPYEDVAILFRTNRSAAGMVQKLMEYNIPFQMRDILPNLYEHWISLNILTYIRVAMGEYTRENFLQIANRPNRYIKRAALNSKEITFENLYNFYKDQDWMIERLEELEYGLKALAKMSPYAGIQYILKGIGYEEYLKEYASFRRLNPKELLEVVDELKESAKDFSSYKEWFEAIEDYKEELKRQRQVKDMDGVILSTMHSAKGLEFPYVYVIDVNEGTIPHEKSSSPEDMEEERRLFYVAMTRAKKQLYVCCTKEKFSKTQEISRFIKEYL